MTSCVLDEVDRQILHMLQEDARSISTDTIGDAVGVAASTVRNRINKLEDAGIIAGYHLEIDYDAADFSLHYIFFCHAPSEERRAISERVHEVSGVVRVDEMIDSDLNILVEAVATDAQHLDDINSDLERCGLEIKRSEIYRESHVQPFNHFGAAGTDK